MSKSYEVKHHVWGNLGVTAYDIEAGTHTPKNAEDVALFVHLVEIGRAEPTSLAAKKAKRSDSA
jgi:hypothetical protein